MIRRRLLSLLLCALLLAGAAVPAQAVNYSATGSLTVRILDTDTKNGIANARVKIYQVAEVDTAGYHLTSGFASGGFDPAKIGELTASENKTEAAKLAEFVKTHTVAYQGSTTGSTGAAVFQSLPLGLYLVVESQSPNGHAPIAPFLITIPQLVDDVYVYHVDAAPKAGTSSTVPTTPPTTRPGGGLPQTGQLWWPVYLLAAAGLTLFLFGWLRRRKHAHE